MSTTEEILNETFKKVGNDFGYETTAEFAAFRDFKARWQRTYLWAEFQLSDYQKKAPQEVIEGIARTIFTKIKGQDCDYDESVVEWLTAPEFVDCIQPIFIGRDRRISTEPGEHKNLEEALDRLREKGFMEDTGKLKIFWSNTQTEGKSAWSSTLMKVIIVNKALDSDEVPDEVLGAIILNEIAQVECNFNMAPTDRCKAVEDRMKMYPGFDRIAEWIEGYGMTV